MFFLQQQHRVRTTMIQKLGQKWEIPLGAWKCETGCCVDEAAPLHCESSGGKEEQQLSRRDAVVVVVVVVVFGSFSKQRENINSITVLTVREL